MKIGSIDIRDRVVIVAEVGNNHEGRMDVAERLVHEAAAVGADAVKFQTFRTEHYVSRADAARFGRLKSFELSPGDFARLAQLAHELDLLFISTPFDLQSVDLLAPLVDAYKIASGDNTFYPLLSKVAHTGKPVIISSGLTLIGEIRRTVEFVRACWQDRGISGDLSILHCVTSYPVRAVDTNLRAIGHLASALQERIGYSDHTIGNDAAVLAVAVGARIVEKHFTLDKQFSTFRDHQLSADPADFVALVKRIRQAEELLGKAEKIVTPGEEEIAPQVRRSIVSGGTFSSGHRLSLADLTWTRPAGGLPPGQEDRLVGHRLRKDVVFGELVKVEDVE